jgi:hypothetical protein
MSPETGSWSVQFLPLADGVRAWNELVADSPDASLYHRDRWIEVLNKAYNLRPSVALAVDGGGRVGAGCVFATVGLPFKRRMVSLPFSDACPPLSPDIGAGRELMAALAARASGQSSLEIRGMAAPEPWQIVDSFDDWRLRLDRSLSSLESGASKHLLRQVRNGLKEQMQIDSGSGLARLRRFYQLMLATRRRQGIPPPPFRLFESVNAVFGEDCKVWLASKGGRDAAGLVVLPDGDRLYYRWGARADAIPPGANHLLFWRLIEESAGEFESLELGRADRRNAGLCRFKRELGAASSPLPYSYYPRAGSQMSAEALTGAARLASRVWQRLPLSVTRVVGTALYQYFA